MQEKSKLRHLCLIVIAAFVLIAVPAQAETMAKKPAFDTGAYQSMIGTKLAISPADIEKRTFATGQLPVMIEVEGLPPALIYANALKAGGGEARALGLAKSQLASVEKAQAPILKALEASGAQILYSTQRVYNGVAALVDPAELGRLSRLPGVSGIYPLVLHEPSNSTSVPFIGATEVWDSLGLDGEGVSIGIIDTGTDYIHTNFGGSGDPSDYIEHATNPAPFFPTAKVVGGHDFAGDLFQPGGPEPINNVPQPDPFPLDCNGHGTHVSGSAAGLGVNANGTTFQGPYDGTVPFSNLLIGPGVAPGASLYALRVFGCSGATFLTTQAIEWAIDPNQDGDLSDHLDVINMSLGSGFGGDLDSSVVASNNAAQAGMIVVVAAGNDGDTVHIVGSPSVAARVMSVSATVDDGLSDNLAVVASPDSIAGTYPIGIATFGPALTQVSGMVAEAFDDDSDGTTTTDGCTAITNPGDVAGKIALIDRGGCGFSVKVQNAQDAGAIAALIVNNQGDFTINMGGSGSGIAIPSGFIGQSNGNAIRGEVGGGVDLTLGVFPAPDRADTIAGFSSRGPARSGNLKPDIGAPGQSITSSLVGSPTTPGVFPLTISGTSMATPHIAGVMAILRQAHPDWSVEELKALAMNYSTQDLFVGRGETPPVFGPSRVGVGRTVVPASATQEVIAYADRGDGLISVSFGNLEVVSPSTYTADIHVVNKGSSSASYAVDYEAINDAAGVDVTVSPSNVTVAGGGSATLTVTLNADPSAMTHDFDPTQAATVNGLPRHWLTEEGGRVVLAGDGTSLWVPVHATVRPASRVFSIRRNFPGGDPTPNFFLDGEAGVLTAVDTAPPIGELSLVTGFELQHMSGDDEGTFEFLNAADLAYVGVTTDYRSVDALGGGLADSTVYFGIAAQANWATPNEVTFNVWIDVDRDGESDFRLWNSSFGNAIGAGRDDVFITLLQDLSSGSVFLADFVNGVPSSAINTVVFNTNVMVLPVPMSLLGGNGRFDYFVTTSSRETLAGDVTPVLTYNAAKPGLDFSDKRNQTGTCPCPGVPAWVDVPGSAVPVQFNRGAFRNNGSLGALLLHHHNASGERAQIVFHGRQLDAGVTKRVSDSKRGGITYFFWDAPADGPSVTISTAGGSGDIVLLARRGYPPTLDSTDYRSDQIGNGESITIETPQAGRYFVAVVGKTPYQGLTVTVTAE